MAEHYKRFSREEVEVAIIDATMSGRVYAGLGEKESPTDFHTFAINHALDAVTSHRERKRKERIRGE